MDLMQADLLAKFCFSKFGILGWDYKFTGNDVEWQACIVPDDVCVWFSAKYVLKASKFRFYNSLLHEIAHIKSLPFDDGHGKYWIDKVRGLGMREGLVKSVIARFPNGEGC